MEGQRTIKEEVKWVFETHINKKANIKKKYNEFRKMLRD